jgi:sugar/nucleoside kinase (ribokinase family)
MIVSVYFLLEVLITLMQHEKELDVLAICNVLKDIIIKVSEEELKDLGLEKGIMHLVSEEEQQRILTKLQDKDKKVEMGGSGANMMRTLAILGKKSSQAGMVGDDIYGEMCLARVNELGIKSNIKKSPIGNTGTSIILITPDGERTMNTCLGMSRCYTVDDIPEEDIKRSKYLLLTGYQWDTDNQIEAVNHAIRIAKANNTKIVFDLSDPFCVDRHRETFMNILEEYVDVVFANTKEANMLSGKSTEESVKMLASLVDVAVVKLGAEGSWIMRGNESVKVPSTKVDVIDTTAAGDMYAGGFMFGLLNNMSLEDCGRIAGFCAETVIQNVGARIPDDLLSRAESHLEKKLTYK